MKIRALTLLATLLLGQVAKAQDDLEYRFEIGAGAGTTAYLGDMNGSPLSNHQLAFTLMARWTPSPWGALKLEATKGKLKGSTQDVTTDYPTWRNDPFTFDRSLYDVSLTGEWNFWAYGTGRDYRGAKRVAPFITAGLGLAVASGQGKTVTTAAIPVGAGVKWKAAPRLNVALEWKTHFSFSDQLDLLQDPYGISSGGMMKNKDGYSRLTLTISYSIMPKCKTCNRD